MKHKLNLLLILTFLTLYSFGQQSTYVDKNGVFRYTNTKKEVRLFGINYTLPFAHGYRAMNYINKDHKKAIDKDVYHFTRLGLDAYRVHIWDMEVTDSLGNLIKTPQLDLLDYLFSKLKERGIKTIITPFKVGDNGYPEKSFPTPGFSSKLEKWQTYAGESVLAKQERYFTQLLNHVNPYTGLAYKNDPDIIALEINNEPRHDNGKIATEYINEMVKIIRKTGFKNPIFYNVSERSEFIDNYLEANIQGCTFQWYPTGLVSNQLLENNFLPNVEKYHIPFNDKKTFQNKTRVIYEFDPGDTNSSVLYPAMARSFREAKFQFATQFAYDPIDLAFANTEYQTHYLNLAYTPSKAISLKIAAEAFREIENGESFGRFPKNNSFANTTLHYQKDLAIYNAEEKFIYTNSTETLAKNISKLKEIVGIGNSEIVKYDGNGAYFLDKIQDGIWRLEVLPDVLWVNDPFEKASLKKTVAVLQNNSNKMSIRLKDLGKEFFIQAINANNQYKTNSLDASFTILPGTYIVSKNELNDAFDSHQKLGNITLNEYATTNTKSDETFIVNNAPKTIEKGNELVVKTSIYSPHKIEKVEVVLPSGYQKTDNYELVKNDLPFEYTTTIPKEKLWNQTFEYYIVVYTNKEVLTFPEKVNGNPSEWDFVSTEKYVTKIFNDNSLIVLYDVLWNDNVFLWPRQWGAIRYQIGKSSTKILSENYLRISSENLIADNPDLTFKLLLKDKLKDEKQHLKETNSIHITASSGSKNKQKVQIAFQLKNGQVFGKVIELTPEMKDYSISYDSLQQVAQVLLPRPYPPFQAYSFEGLEKSDFDISELEALQISIGPELSNSELKEYQEVRIQKIILNK